MMHPALRYLSVRLSGGGVKHRLARLKNPRYLVPMVLAVGWLWLSFGMPGITSRAGNPTSGHAQWVRLFVGPGMGILLAINWLFAPSRPAPAFTRAEASQLFTLPISRRSLITYRLLRPQLTFLLIACFAFGGAFRSADIKPVFAGIGAFLILNLVSLNAMCAALACNRMKRAGLPWPIQTIPGLLIVAWVAVPIALNWRAFVFGEENLAGWVRERVTGDLIEVVHWPLQQIAKVIGASDWAGLGLGALTTVVVIGPLYGLCMVLIAPFEEESLKISEAAGKKIDAMRRGGFSSLRASKLRKIRSTRLPLNPTGSVWRAMFWQTLTAEWRVGPWKLTYTIAFLFLAITVVTMQASSRVSITLMLGMFSVTGGWMLLLLFPRMMATGLHIELKRLPLLKSLPLTGNALLRGKTWAGVLLITGPVLTFLVAGLSAAATVDDDLSRPLLGAILVAAIPCIMATALVMIVLESATVLMFPAWMVTAQGETGFENMGRNMLSLFVRVLGFSILIVIPGVLAAVAVVVGVTAGQIPIAVMIGGLIGAVATFGEVELLMLAIGKRFDLMDASPESQ